MTMDAMTRNSGRYSLTILIALVVILAACSDSSDSGAPAAAKPQAANPLVEGPVTGGGGPDCCKIVFGGVEIDVTSIIAYVPGTPFYPPTLTYDLAEVGYREAEFFVSGTATAYVSTDELTEDGRWSVQPADTADYKTRMVVIRPIDPVDFSGTVVVEWFNVSGGTDAAPDWIQLHTELIRKGHAWVGVSAQIVGVEGGVSFPASLKIIDAERYGELSHPGDSFSYDIYSQAAQAVRNPDGLDPLDGLEVEYLIGVGESQSAGRMATYVNAIHPTIDLFDGFLIHSRRTGAAPLSQAPQPEITSPRPSFIRTDIPEPVIGFEAEGDVAGREGREAAVPNPDSENYRLWEVPGNAHFDAYGVVKGPEDKGDDPGVAEVIEFSSAIASGLIECELPINDGPGHWVLKAAFRALEHWVRTGEAAPAAERIPRLDDGSDVVRDDLGNAIGGIRTPYVDAPVATFSGGGQTGSSFCGSFGTTSLFDEAALSSLYPTREDYIEAIDTSTDSAVSNGFILPEDGELIKAQARLSDKFAD
jgi:hypothetical protein